MGGESGGRGFWDGVWDGGGAAWRGEGRVLFMTNKNRMDLGVAGLVTLAIMGILLLGYSLMVPQFRTEGVSAKATAWELAANSALQLSEAQPRKSEAKGGNVAAGTANSTRVAAGLVLAIPSPIAEAAAAESAGPGPLKVTAPEGWEVNFGNGYGLSHYTIRAGKPGTALLTLSVWPPGGSPEKIPELVEGLAQGFAQAAQSDATLSTIDANYTRGAISGEVFSGNYAEFKISTGDRMVVQTLYMISDGQTIWNGQYTGTESGWEQAKGVLGALRKN